MLPRSNFNCDGEFDFLTRSLSKSKFSIIFCMFMDRLEQFFVFWCTNFFFYISFSFCWFLYSTRFPIYIYIFYYSSIFLHLVSCVISANYNSRFFFTTLCTFNLILLVSQKFMIRILVM